MSTSNRNAIKGGGCHPEATELPFMSKFYMLIIFLYVDILCIIGLVDDYISIPCMLPRLCSIVGLTLDLRLHEDWVL